MCVTLETINYRLNLEMCVTGLSTSKPADLCEDREERGGGEAEPATQKSQTHLPRNGQGQGSYRLCDSRV